MDPSNIPTVDATVTCRTGGCINQDVPLDVPIAEENPHVICGPCGNQITDIIPVVD